MVVHSKAKQKTVSGRTKRVQTVLSKEQYEVLLRVAKKEKKTVCALVRQAVEVECLEEELRTTRQHALKNLLSLDAPVSEWEEMESEIVKGVIGG